MYQITQNLTTLVHKRGKETGGAKVYAQLDCVHFFQILVNVHACLELDVVEEAQIEGKVEKIYGNSIAAVFVVQYDNHDKIQWYNHGVSNMI